MLCFTCFFKDLVLPVCKHSFVIMSTPSKTHKKRKLQTLETKYQAIKDVEDGKKKAEFARQLDITSNTLSTWLKNKETIKRSFESQQLGLEMKRMNSQFQDVEVALFAWFRQAHSRDINISQPILLAKAQDLGKNLFHQVTFLKSIYDCILSCCVSNPNGG